MNVSDIFESGLLELYVLDELSPSERLMVEGWIIQHPEVKAEIGIIENTFEKLATSQALPVRADVRQSIINHIENENKSAKVKPQPDSNSNGITNSVSHGEMSSAPVEGTPPIPNEVMSPFNRPVKNNNNALRALPWFLCAAMALSSLYYFSELRKQKSAVENCESQQRQNAKNYVETERAINILKNTDTKRVELIGLKISPESKVNIYWNAQKAETMLSIVNLPAPPEKMQYQLWAIVDKKPVSAGVFEYNPDSLQFMKAFPKAEAFAITLEKQGGTEAPTLDKMYVMGTP